MRVGGVCNYCCNVVVAALCVWPHAVCVWSDILALCVCFCRLLILSYK